LLVTALELSAGSHARRRARRPASAADVVTGLPSLPEADQAAPSTSPAMTY